MRPKGAKNYADALMHCPEAEQFSTSLLIIVFVVKFAEIPRRIRETL